MSLLATHKSTQRLYKNVIEQSNSIIDKDRAARTTELIEKLPSYLCTLLASNSLELQHLPQTLESAVVGTDDSRLLLVESKKAKIYWCVSGFPDFIFAKLPLSGHFQATYKEYQEQYLREALAELDVLGNQYAENVLEFSSLLIWLEIDLCHPPKAPVTSVTLPSFPHCSFITSRALYHIPPLFVFSRKSAYALCENLYHESLHQQMTATLLQEDILTEEYDPKTTSKIYIPWRKTSWEPDRVLHASFVYTNLIQMRKDKLIQNQMNVKEHDLIANSVRQSKIILKYLIEQFSNMKDAFSPTGWQFIKEIKVQAEKVIQ